MSRLRPGALAFVVALALTACACGVPTSGSPSALSKGDVPQLAPTSTTTTSPGFLQFTVVWLSDTNTASAQFLYNPHQSDRLNDALGALLAGPTPPKQFITAIPPGTRLIGVSPNPNGLPAAAPNTPVIVNLSNTFTLSSGLDEVLAVEQVVFTIACNLTPAARISVSFEVAGDPLEVPVPPSGSPVSRPVTPADYGFTPADCTPA